MTTRLVKHHKLTKRQIKEDPLVTAAGRGIEAWERYGTRILIGLGALALVLLLVFFVGRTRAQAERRAGGDLMRGQMSLMQQDYPTAVQMLKEIVDSAPGTRAARHAMLLLGDAYMEQGKPAEAVGWYRRYLGKAGKDAEAKAAGHHGLAASLEDRGDFVQAAANYHELAAIAQGDNERGRAMLAEARCLTKAGQTPKAVELYKQIQRLPVVDQDIYFAASVAQGELTASAPPTR